MAPRLGSDRRFARGESAAQAAPPSPAPRPRRPASPYRDHVEPLVSVGARDDVRLRRARAVAARRRSALSACGRHGAVAALPRSALALRCRRGRRAWRGGWGACVVKVGIVGLPNAGKSTLFSALTGVQAQAANYPFTTIDPNVAIVPVPDERLDAVAATLGSTPITYETIEFHDIAGLVRGAHSGEGLGNRFLANIREVDAIVHVVRAHADPNVVHPEGRVDPATDIETIETELVYADLEQSERRLERVVKQARSGEKAAIAEEAWLREVIAALQEGRWTRTVPAPADAPEALRNLWPLTGKPVLYVVNVGEGDEEAIPPVVAEHAAKTGAAVVAISARIEAELA